ncbi:hypothetical protein JB92DRAFT_1313095 [Gautieria morchelliformis]|nr:hypothetical protein JB92DRAFT_1313095 [Gautieria morchelliformis]
MEGNTTGFPHLNPDTSLAFLPPSLAGQLEATRYLSITALAAFTWDLLCTSGQDYRLIKGSINVPTLVYFLSRVSSLVHIVATTVFHVAPVDSCAALPMVIGWCWAVAIPSTSLLFFFRIRAVFDRQKWIVAFFVVLWLATLGGAITVPFAITGGHIANTNRCQPTAVKPFSSASIIASTCNDTLVFIAISWRIITRTTVNSRAQSFFCGGNLPYLSRELLRGGQQYYLVTVGGNVIIMAMILSPATPPLLKDMFPVINMALENSMACRVFRNIKLGSNKAEASMSGIGASEPSSQEHALRNFSGKDGRPTHLPTLDISKVVETFTSSDGDLSKSSVGDIRFKSQAECV